MTSPQPIRWNELPDPPEWGEQDPLIPLHGYFPDNPPDWMAMHDRHVAEAQARKDAIQIVFLGDSITQGWGGEGQALWQERYAPREAANFGIGGDRTQQVLWRIERGLLDNLNPRLVVLKIGVNNLWAGEIASERIAEGRARCVAAIREKCSHAKILLLGILPTQKEADNPLRARIRAINALSAALHDGETVHYLDIGARFVEPDGTISPEIMPDYCHLSPAGYQIWADAMQPHFDALLK